MAQFFHLDRGNLLVEGQTIELEKKYDYVKHSNPKLTETFRNHYDKLFPNGVTMHGEHYFAKPTVHKNVNSVLELVFEYVRRSDFIDKPSRAESFFALDSLGDVFRIAQKLNNINVQNCSIWEVESETFHRADMQLLDLGTNLMTSFCAHEYWSGTARDDTEPLWEYLLVPPVKIVRKLNIYTSI
jgi:hypothetical protein